MVEPFCKEVLEIPFVTVVGYHGKLHDYYLERGNIPIIGIRGCTKDFKILPINRHIRKIVGNGRGFLLCQVWLGISTDEKRRGRYNDGLIYVQKRFPLLEADISRDDCIKLLKEKGWKVKRSGCFCCPYAGSSHYKELRDDHPELFEICQEMERKMRAKSKCTIGLCRYESVLEIDLDAVDIPNSECDPEEGGCFI